MANGIPDSWKKVNSYGNSVLTLNEKCLSKNTTGGVYFNFINVLYFSLIHKICKKTPLNISFVFLDILGVILCDYFYDM